jgi:3-deoxy-manno-octulosonate cytidylyltransferase (CMP-KDO synthetase)
MVKTLCVIPARLGSSRYPNKPLMKILGMPMIGHVALRCKLEGIFDQVVVATCDQEIKSYCDSIDVETVMTSDKHERASDRVQEAARLLEAKAGSRFDIVTMVQGDEPMVTPTMLQTALQAMITTQAEVVNLRSRIDSEDEFLSANCVKVVVRHDDRALYFTRSPVPNASKSPQKFPIAFKQVCIIPFKRDFLDLYSSLVPTYLEEVESIDMNRVLEHGYEIHCPEINEKSYPVDVPDDLIRVEQFLKGCLITKSYLGSA